MRVNDREELNSSELGRVGLSIHESLDHLDDLLLHLLDVHLPQDAFYAVDRLVNNNGEGG